MICLDLSVYFSKSISYPYTKYDINQYMVMSALNYKSWHKIAVPIMGLVCSQASAAPLEPVILKVFYDFPFAGILFAHLGIKLPQPPSKYTITADVASTGIV